jgi:uncharacterized repeat protein (TIGR03803 family)
MFRTWPITSAFLSGVTLCGAAAPAQAGKYELLYSFSGIPDGHEPRASLVDVGGTLYGTTYWGGNLDSGTVFAFDPATGAEKVVYSFQGGTGGAKLESSLTDVGGLLYGATLQGGVKRQGIVFSLDPATGAETVLASFGGARGKSPGGLIGAGSKIYGTTLAGPGKNGDGTVFSVNTSTGATTTVHAFTGSDGISPNFGLINVHGTLYGTTTAGGSGSGCESTGCGAIFFVDPATGTDTVVYSFKGGSDAQYPLAGLIDVGGTLYGTTPSGGVNGLGAVFSYKP